jgi:hypothetical protein
VGYPSPSLKSESEPAELSPDLKLEETAPPPVSGVHAAESDEVKSCHEEDQGPPAPVPAPVIPGKRSPVKLTPEEVIEKAKQMRAKREEERENSIGIQSEPYYDRQYNYTYETRKHPLCKLTSYV